MTPQEIQAWYDEHGGAAGPPEGPDANGVTMHRAASGDYIAVRRDGSLAMRGFSAPDTTAASATPAQPVAPPSGEAKNVKDDASFQAWLNLHGGEVSRKDKHGKVSDPSGEIDPATNKPKQIDAVESTTVEAQDGSTITLSRSPSGDGYVFIGNTPPKKTPASQAGVTGSNPRVPAGSVPRIEGTPIPGQPGQYDNSQPIRAWHTPSGEIVYEPLTPQEVQQWRSDQQGNQQTGEVRKPVDGRPGWTSVTRATAQNGNKTETTVYIGPDGKEVPTLPAENKPTQAADGSWGYWDQSSGTPKWTPIANGPAGQKYTQVKQDPQTGAWSGLTAAGAWEPISGGPGIVHTGTPAEPAGAPPASTDYGQTTASLVRYRDFLNEQVRNKTLTPEQADKLMQARLTQAQSAMAEQQGVVNTQTGIYGQQITQRGQSIDDTTSRRTAAENAYSTVMTNFMPLLKYMPKGGGQAFLDLLGHGMGAALQNATNWGGQTEHPEIQMGPAAAAANAAPMPGTQGTFLAGAIPPNAIGAGSVGAVPAPGAPIGQVAAGVTATNAAAVNPTGANVQAATDATMQGSNAAFGALGVPAQQPSQPTAPIFRPQQPVDVPPTGAQSFLAPYQGQQQQPSVLDQLLNDPWLPNDVVARAYQDVHGVPMSSYGMS